MLRRALVVVSLTAAVAAHAAPPVDSLRAAAPAAEPLPRGEVTLRDALAAALLDNRSLAPAVAAVHVREGQALQAGTRPNPELKLELENFGGSGANQALESAETTLRLSQLVELGGKRARRLAVAGLERDGAQWDYEARRANVLADTAKAFADVLALQERVALADELTQLAGLAAQAVDAQVRGGGAAPVEITRAQLAGAQAALQRADRARELATARLALAAQWGSSTADFTRARGRLDSLTPPPALAPLLSGIDRNPDLARWATELATREAAIDLERARAVPDITLGAGPRYLSDTDEVALVLEFWVPLPLFDRNQGAIAAAEAELAQSDAARRAAESAVRSALSRTHEAVGAAYDRAIALRDHLLPAAATLRAGVADAYRQGALRSLDVLDAQRTEFELRDEYLVALAAYQQALADLDRLAGTPPEPTQVTP
jgi:cobalt-zinc-cadmium efflux system outer membrane protein